MEQSSLTFRCQQIIVEELSRLPYVGFENTTSPDGWKFDIKRWSSPFDLKFPSLPRLSDSSFQGVRESEYFKSGVGDKDLGDLNLLRISSSLDNGKSSWTPIIKAGTYFRFKTPFYYYSDDSIVQYLNKNENIDNRNYIELEEVPSFDSPILAASFKRNSRDGSISYRTLFSQQSKFTGLYTDGEELITVTDAGRINWENVDTLKKEFIVDHSIDGLYRLFFNRDYEYIVGKEVETELDLAACEQLGVSSGSGELYIVNDETPIYVQSYYLKNFPVFSGDDFHLYIKDSSGYEEWSQVDSWWELLYSEISNQYYIDKDFGVVHFVSFNPLLLPLTGSEIIASYSVNLRIEYEKCNSSKEVFAYNSNVNPVTQGINQGFVCITHENLEPASITLSIDKPLIDITASLKEYGPLEIGVDYGILTANVKSASGINLSNIPVTFEMTPSEIGLLSGSTLAYSSTNGQGNAYANYQPPNRTDEMGFYSTIVRDCTHPDYSEYKEVVVLNSSPGLENQEENTYLYQIQKDDIILGYSTIEDFLDQLYIDQSPAWVVDETTRTRWDSEMTIKYNLKGFTDPQVEGEPIDGRKVIVYKIDNVPNFNEAAINPTDGTLGAVLPVSPILINQITSEEDSSTAGFWRLIYSAGALADCGPSEPIGGYWVISTRVVKFTAHCWSPYYNKEIYSNDVYVRLTLPDYMLGVYTNEEGQKIPFGWKIISELDIVSSAINGATFITINPSSGPYPILDLVNNTGATGDYASAPYRSVGLQFNLEITPEA